MLKSLITKILLSAFTILNAQTISFSFDDAPTAGSSVFTGKERTELLVENLRKAGIDTAVFYCVGENIIKEGTERLTIYSGAGHIIANHTFTHDRIRTLTPAGYLNEISVTDTIINKFTGYRKYFRYTFLDEGRTKGERDSVREGLLAMGYTNGYVTVDNYDWYLNDLYLKAVTAGKKIDMARLRRIYLDHIIESIRFYDDIAKKHLGRSPHHVLLLHENDLAAMFIDDLADELKNSGWKFISPETAYSDPIAAMVPDVLFNGQGRIAAIANSMCIKPALLVQESEDEEYLGKIFEECVIK